MLSVPAAPSTPELLSHFRASFRPALLPSSFALDATAPFFGAEHVSAVPPAFGVCCWDRLATVESQSVLQFLDIRSKLHAARCCRRLLQDASAQFAWHYSPPLLLAVSAEGKKDELTECVRHAVAWASAGLLRFAPVHLSLGQTDDQRRRAQQIDVSAECVAAITHLVSLDGRFLWRPRLWTELLQLPQACNLRELHGGKFNDEQMQLIVRLPALERICLRLGRPSCLQLLPTAPALTELSIHTQDNRGPLGLLLEALGRCGPFPAQMRSLQVHSLCLTRTDHGGNAFTALCRLPLMPQLTFLALHNLRVESSTLSSSAVQTTCPVASHCSHSYAHCSYRKCGWHLIYWRRCRVPPHCDECYSSRCPYLKSGTVRQEYRHPM
jgi:hypothetical protein